MIINIINIEVTRHSEDESGVDIARYEGENSLFVLDTVLWSELVKLFGDLVFDMELGESRCFSIEKI